MNEPHFNEAHNMNRTDVDFYNFNKNLIREILLQNVL